MNLVFEIDRLSTAFDAGMIKQLKRIYSSMDQEYKRAADHYGFNCDGCRDNCCRTRFCHHTYVEFLYIIEGIKTLTRERQKEITSQAMTVVYETAKTEDNKGIVRLMCPLNFNELCILYPYRPMICRLHGIPHELKKPLQNVVYGPGCETFDHRCGHKGYFKFDRTPFYREMANIENELRKKLKIGHKIRMSIAEMLLKGAEGIAHRARG
jgi:Fe-S-cluster containining protein